MSTKQKRLERSGDFRWCRLGNMRVSDVAQRALNRAKVDQLLAEFDLDHVGIPEVSERAGNFWILDGQHRIEALKGFLGEGWEDQQVFCHVYTGLTEREEAEKFLRHNDSRVVTSFDKFKAATTAGREVEVQVRRIVESLGLHISRTKETEGAISCVSTLCKVYRRAGGDVLARGLMILRDAFGSPGLDSAIIDGITLVCARYDVALSDSVAVDRLAAVHGGVNGLLGRADTLRLQTGNQKPQCVAAAIVDIINSKRGGAKLPSWWKG